MRKQQTLNVVVVVVSFPLSRFPTASTVGFGDFCGYVGTRKVSMLEVPMIGFHGEKRRSSSS